MFIARWEGAAPLDKRPWFEALREALASELGSYRVLFEPAGKAWRFVLEWREDDQVSDDGLIANSPGSVAWNVYHSLVERDLPVDREWTPGPADVRDASSSPSSPRSRRSAGRRTTPGR
jgi:hypothetical protein